MYSNVYNWVSIVTSAIYKYSLLGTYESDSQINIKWTGKNFGGNRGRLGKMFEFSKWADGENEIKTDFI